MKIKITILIFFSLISFKVSFSQEHTITLSPNGWVASLLLSAGEYESWIINDDYNNNSKLIDITSDVYKIFNDDFDFIFFVLNESELPTTIPYYGELISVSNSISGLGLYSGLFNYSSFYGSDNNLKAVMQLSTKTAIKYGPALHELMHTWGNFGIDTEGSYDGVSWFNFVPHWGITGGNTKGQLGGFKQSSLQLNIDSDSNKYRVEPFGPFANGGNSVPYSQLELYLMGLIPVTDIEPFDVFTGITSFDISNQDFYSFTANSRKTYTPSKIIEELGERIPSFEASQKKFKLLTVVLTPKPLEISDWAPFEENAEWFSLPADDGESYIFNFYEATGGRATIELGNLQNSLKNGTIKFTIPQKSLANIYLNHVENQVYVSSLNDKKIKEVSIFNEIGSLTQKKLCNDKKTTIDISKLPAGIYIVKTTMENNMRATRKVIKQ